MTIHNKSHKVKQRVNRKLKNLSDELKLSIPLKIKTARETYATHLIWFGESKDNVGIMLGHANSMVTENYLGGMNQIKNKTINDRLG